MKEMELKKLVDSQVTPAEHFSEIMQIIGMGGSGQLTAIRLFVYGQIVGRMEAKKSE